MSGDERLRALLADVNAAKPGADDALAEAVDAELRAMARRHLARDFGANLAGVTIQPTVLANDTLMKLIRQRQSFDNAGHLFAIASRLMMRVLLDYHRERKAAKRGGAAGKVMLDTHLHDRPDEAKDSGVDVEVVNEAIEKLARLDERKAEVVKYRILWDFTISETAEALGVGDATVERDWAFARAWLARELQQCRT
jgi:RNA polymerase sigma-70 factor, ECF subfamily